MASKLFSANQRSPDIAASYAACSAVPNEIANRLLQRLDYVKLQPKSILDLGAGAGQSNEVLANKYPAANIYSLDISVAMLQANNSANKVVANAMQLPIANHSIDMVFANCLLPFINDLPRFFTEVNRVLTKEGLLLFSALGPDSLQELLAAYKAIETKAEFAFIDMHDIGDDMLQAGLIDPVVDMEMLTVQYASVPALLRELRSLGAGSKSSFSNTVREMRSLINAYPAANEGSAQEEAAKINASCEVIYGLAWGRGEQMQQQYGDEVLVPFSKASLFS